MLTTLLSEMGQKKKSNYKFKLEPILVLFLSLMLIFFFIYFIQQVRHQTLKTKMKVFNKNNNKKSN